VKKGDENALSLVSDKEGALADPEWSEFLPVPDPEIIKILSYLSLYDLISLKDIISVMKVNRKAHWLARIALHDHYKDESKKQFVVKLNNDPFLQYLPNIAWDLPIVKDRKFIDYVQLMVGVVIEPENQAAFDRLSVCFNSLINKPQFPPNWNGRLVKDANELQEQAQCILKDFSQETIQTATSWIQLMDQCPQSYTLMQREMLWRRYRFLASEISTLLLFARIKNVVRANQQNPPHQPIDYLGLLINPEYSCWLTGYGLIALDAYIPGIFPLVVREALRLFKKIDKDEAENERLAQIERVLDQLTPDDLLRYIPEDQYDKEYKNPPADPVDQMVHYNRTLADRKRGPLIEAIKDDYSLLLKKMSGAVLFRIERSDWRRNPPENEFDLKEFRIVPLILQRAILLRNLKPDEIVKLLLIIRDNDKCTAISHEDYRALWPCFTFGLLMEWLAKEHKSCVYDYVKVILTQQELLEKFDDPKDPRNTQILSLARYLHSDDLEEILNSPIFLVWLKKKKKASEDKKREENADASEGENTLLMELAKTPDTYFDITITKNPNSARLLTHNEIMELVLIKDSCNIEHLIKHDAVLNKMTGTELFNATHRNIKCRNYIADGHLWRLDNNNHLIVFSARQINYLKKSNNELIIFIQKLSTELQRRVERCSDRMTSAQWLDLACLTPDLGVIIANQYLDNLDDVDLAALNRHFQQHETIPQLIYAVQNNRRKEIIELKVAEEQKQQLIIEQQYAEQEADRANRLSPRIVSWNLISRPRSSSENSAEPIIAPKRDRWKTYLAITLLALACFIGFCLVAIGIASAIGVSVAVTITAAARMVKLLPVVDFGQAYV
jgi:hypothetical protein